MRGLSGRFASMQASFATKAVSDYSLTMAKANELSSNTLEVPKGEVGKCAGNPSETYSRPVSPMQPLSLMHS